jgi:hypothetical protein
MVSCRRIQVLKELGLLRPTTIALAIIGLALPIYSDAQLIRELPRPLGPDADWAIILTGIFLATGLPALIMATRGKARKTAFALSLAAVVFTFGALPAMMLVAKYLGGE